MADGKESEQFSSRLGLILTTIGAAVGTGNIWRFPREAAANGGGAFMIGWLLFLFAWSIPLLIAEFAIGKKTRLGTVGAMRDMAGRNFTLARNLDALGRYCCRVLLCCSYGLDNTIFLDSYFRRNDCC